MSSTIVNQLDRRILGTFDRGRTGPTVIALGGIHGNEHAGIAALQRVLGKLQESDLEFHGRLIAVAGNVAALRRGERFLDRDLNRQWLPENTATLSTRADGCSEDHEQRELLEVFEHAEAQAPGPLVFLDLHTSSADGPPFSCLSDTLPNRRVALSIPVPAILGLEECIDGAVMEHFSSRGHVAVAVEGGRHDAESTVDNLEAAVWIVLVAVGAVPRRSIRLEPFHQRLRAATRHLPSVLEVRHRQAITPADRFVMEPGFLSFDIVQRGQLLAHDARGEVRAREHGCVLLPLYQGQGEDGFFLARPVRRFWLRVAAVCQHLRIGHVLHWLPGVRNHPHDRSTLIVEPRIARWFVVELFHLCGYRRQRPRDGKLWFSRRFARREAFGLKPR